MRNLMTTFKMFLLLLVTVVTVASCSDKDEVNDSSGDYYYLLDIQSEVRLYLNDAADEDESGIVNPMIDSMSRTIYRMQKAVRESDHQQGNRNKVAIMLSTCDSLYREYAEVYPEQKGNVICCVKLLRCPLNPNGTANLKDAITLKYYYFWREESGMIIPNLGLAICHPNSIY